MSKKKFSYDRVRTCETCVIGFQVQRLNHSATYENDTSATYENDTSATYENDTSATYENDTSEISKDQFQISFGPDNFFFPKTKQSKKTN